jgi:hypothetical protein
MQSFRRLVFSLFNSSTSPFFFNRNLDVTDILLYLCWHSECFWRFKIRSSSSAFLTSSFSARQIRLCCCEDVYADDFGAGVSAWPISSESRERYGGGLGNNSNSSVERLLLVDIDKERGRVCEKIEGK